MPTRILTALGGAVLIVAANPLFVAARPAGPSDLPNSLDAPRQHAYVDVARVIEASDIGLASPTSVTFAPESASLLVSGINASGNPTVTSVSLFGEVEGSDPVPADVADAGLAYDPTNDVLIAAPSDDRLVTIEAPGGEVAPGTATTDIDVSAADLGTPIGLGVSPRGEPLVLGSNTVVQTLTVPAPGAPASVTKELGLAGVSEGLTGLAIAPNGNLFSFGTESMTLYEFRANGKLLATRDLSGEGIDAFEGMVIAPTADTSDARGATSLYLADAGTPAGVGAAIYEISLTAPVLSPQVAAAATTSITLENTFSTGAGSAWNPDSPDPSGLAYIAASETNVPAARRDRLVAVDGEVDETTGAGWNNVNVWYAPRNGSVQTSTFNTTVAPTNPINNEPVGAAYDPVRNELYICKDGADGRIWVYNAVTMAQVRSFTVTGAPYNNADAEGLAFGNGTLYMVDAIDNDLVKVQPGGNGIVGSGGDDVVTNYDLEQYGQREPEGLDVHPETGNIWVVSNRLSGQGDVPDPMIEVTPTGGLLSTISIAAANPNSAGGLAIAPPSDSGGGFNVYIADRGEDNGNNPNENDGEIYEFSLGDPPPAAPDTTITDGPTGTVSSPDASFTFTGTAGTTSFECQLDAGGFSACTSPKDYTGLADGDHTFEVRALNGSTPDLTPAARTWTIELAPADPVSYPAVVRDGQWFLRHGNTSASAAVTFLQYGAATDLPLFGDWDGDGVATPGIVRAGVWHLRNTNSGGAADVFFGYGAASGDIPVAGDWDGDGVDTPGIVRNGVWHLRNSLSGGPADITFSFGRATDQPIVGDWDGDGDDTVGVVRDGRWFLSNSSGGGASTVTFVFGRATDQPIVGDWDGDGDDTVGVVRDARWFLANTAGGNADHTFVYGRSTDKARVWSE